MAWNKRTRMRKTSAASSPSDSLSSRSRSHSPLPTAGGSRRKLARDHDLVPLCRGCGTSVADRHEFTATRSRRHQAPDHGAPTTRHQPPRHPPGCSEGFALWRPLQRSRVWCVSISRRGPPRHDMAAEETHRDCVTAEHPCSMAARRRFSRSETLALAHETS